MAPQQTELIHTPDYQQIKQDFLNELILASQNKPSSLSFIKHHLPDKPLLTHGIVQGIVIGGTNYIFSTEKINSDGTKEILERKTGTLPIFKTKQTFLDFLSEHLDPRAKAIGINFGFPMQTTTGSQGEIDGKLIKGTKEHAFDDLHEPIGQLTKTIFYKYFKREIPVSIANDTICLALSGNGSEKAAFVVGTGFNMCLLLKNENKKTLVNLECGNFNKFTLSPTLKNIDEKSEQPGEQLFEKLISGKYLVHYFNEKAKALNLPLSPLSTSQELSELATNNQTTIANNLARTIIERSAFLVASALAGIYEFCGKPASFVVIGEGSLLWNGWRYHENVQKKCHDLGIPADALIIKHVPDSSIAGAIGLLTGQTEFRATT